MDDTSDGTPRPQRTQFRLRLLIDELQAGIRENRITLQASHRKIDTLAERVDDLAREVGALQKALAEFVNRQ